MRYYKVHIQRTPSLGCQAHWQNAQSQRSSQILPKSLPAHPAPSLGLKKFAAKLNINRKLMNNGQHTTMCIKNCRDSSKFKVCSSFQVHRNLILMSFEIGNISYTYRCMPFWESANSKI